MPLLETNYWLKLRSRTIDFKLVCRGIQVARAQCKYVYMYIVQVPSRNTATIFQDNLRSVVDRNGIKRKSK